MNAKRLVAIGRGVAASAVGAIARTVSFALLLLPSLVFAQGAHIDLRAPTSSQPATVAVRGVLADRKFDELLRNGFPMRLNFRAEVWQEGRWFDDPVSNAEWRVGIRYDSFDGTYEVVRVTGAIVTNLGTYKKLIDARAASELPYSPSLALPVVGRKGYVTVHVEVQTIEMSDLDEVQQWLRGDVRPAVQGKKNPGTALTRGLKQLVTRLLGGEVRHLEARQSIVE